MSIEQSLNIRDCVEAAAPPQRVVKAVLNSDREINQFVTELSIQNRGLFDFSGSIISTLKELLYNALEHGDGDSVIFRCIISTKAAVICIENPVKDPRHIERVTNFFQTGQDYYGYTRGALGAERGCGFKLLQTSDDIKSWYEFDETRNVLRIMLFIASEAEKYSFQILDPQNT